MFRQRLAQLKFVERIVRPVRCTTPRKRKMREELLAHLSAIYDEELSRTSDPDAAWHTAVERFGAPAELTCELQHSVSWSDRVSYYFERWSRLASARNGQSLDGTSRDPVGRTVCPDERRRRSDHDFQVRLVRKRIDWHAPSARRADIVAYSPLRIRSSVFQDARFHFGAFGSRRSNLVAGGMALLMGLSVFAAFLVFVALTYPGFDGKSDLIQIVLTALATPLCALVIVRNVGRQEIRDALWACMDIEIAARNPTSARRTCESDRASVAQLGTN